MGILGVLTRNRILVGRDDCGLSGVSGARAGVSALSLRVLELRRVGSERFGVSVTGLGVVGVDFALGDGFGALDNDFRVLDLTAGGGGCLVDERGVDACLCVVLAGFELGEPCATFRAPLVTLLALGGCSSSGSAFVRPDLRFPSSINVVGPSAAIFFQGGDSSLGRRIGRGGVVSRTRRRLEGRSPLSASGASCPPLISSSPRTSGDATVFEVGLPLIEGSDGSTYSTPFSFRVSSVVAVDSSGGCVCECCCEVAMLELATPCVGAADWGDAVLVIAVRGVWSKRSTGISTESAFVRVKSRSTNSEWAEDSDSGVWPLPALCDDSYDGFCAEKAFGRRMMMIQKFRPDLRLVARIPVGYRLPNRGLCFCRRS